MISLSRFILLLLKWSNVCNWNIVRYHKDKDHKLVKYSLQSMENTFVQWCKSTFIGHMFNVQNTLSAQNVI